MILSFIWFFETRLKIIWNVFFTNLLFLPFLFIDYRFNAARAISISRHTVSISNAQSRDDSSIMAYTINVFGSVGIQESVPLVAANKYNTIKVSVFFCTLGIKKTGGNFTLFNFSRNIPDLSESVVPKYLKSSKKKRYSGGLKT